jgi:hypothetical protein
MVFLLFFPHNNPSLVLDLVQILASISVIISSLEFLVMRNILTDTGLMSWKKIIWTGTSGNYDDCNDRIDADDAGSNNIHGHWLRFQSLGLKYVFGYPGVLVVICIRLVCAVLLLLLFSSSLLGLGIIKEEEYNNNHFIQTILVSLISITSIILVVRTPYGHSGADQMILIVFVTISIAYIFDHVIITRTEALFFITAQACLAYFTSGVYKARSESWRSGKALVKIFSSETFGNKTIARFLDSNHTITTILANSMILFECCFPLVLLSSPILHLTEVLLIIGVLFHIFNAIFMRLNTFFGHLFRLILLLSIAPICYLEGNAA